jgi:hypothetical protein
VIAFANTTLGGVEAYAVVIPSFAAVMWILWLVGEVIGGHPIRPRRRRHWRCLQRIRRLERENESGPPWWVE